MTHPKVRPEDLAEAYDPSYDEEVKKYKEELAKLDRPWNFEAINGMFKQADPETDEATFDYLQEDFGVKTSWKSLCDQVSALNAKCGETETYKVLFLARHGQGYHNFAIIKYGQKAWDEKWSKLCGDGEITWGPDPYLTDLGISQALDNHKVWKEQVKDKNAPLPRAFYSSPFTRSCQTLVYTWQGIVEPTNSHPLIKEDIRETIGEHTCDKRSPKRVIEERFVEKHGFKIESGFEEEDVYYKDDYREKMHEQTLRINNFLNFLFEKDYKKSEKDVYISVTSHSGTIKSFLMALGHRKFAVGTGGMIPVVVRGVRKQ